MGSVLFHNVVIIEKEEKKQTGFEIPKTETPIGIIKEVGQDIEADLKVGDRVVYFPNSLLEIEYDGKKEFILDFDDIVKKI